jgi:branched-chain amino acid transport system permease protein
VPSAVDVVRTTGAPVGEPRITSTPNPAARSVAKRTRSLVTWLVVIAGFVLLPMVASNAWLTSCVFLLIYIIGALGLNILTGMTGQISLGHAFFFGVGAFTAAVLGSPKESTLGAVTDTIGLDLPWVIWLPAAGLAAGLCGLAISPTAARLRGLTLGIVTIGLTSIGVYLFQNLPRLTGGSGGRAIPDISLFGHPLAEPVLFFGVLIGREGQWFYFCAVWVVLAVLFTRNLVRSRAGRAFLAIREKDVAAGMLGINVVRYKISAFVISGVFAGIAGALFAGFLGLVAGATQFNLAFSVQFIIMIIVGGEASVLGSILGATAVTLLPTLMQQSQGLFPFLSELPGAPGIMTGAQFSTLVYGLLLMTFVMFKPAGLVSYWEDAKHFFSAWPFKN